MAEAVNFPTLRKSLLDHKYAPVYILHGEEAYYTDELAKLFDDVVPADLRDFNTYTFYAPQADAETISETCRRYPMMSERQLVVVKEAQNVAAKWFDKLVPYVEQPSPTTVLVVIGRGAKLKSTEIAKKAAKANGVVFESAKLKEFAVGAVIRDIVKEQQLSIEDKALAMLQEFVGTDLSRIYNEVNKLAMILGKGAMITPESIERNIGVSKDYNNYELVAAIARRDVLKVTKISQYFRANPKNNPTVVTAAVLFKYFSDLLAAIYSPDKSERGLMATLGFRFPGQLRDIRPGLTNYHPWQVIKNISALRQFDANTKGIGSRLDPYDLLDQLLFTLLNNTPRA